VAGSRAVAPRAPRTRSVRLVIAGVLAFGGIRAPEARRRWVAVAMGLRSEAEAAGAC
jgi:hypothetical protein